jgi:hypothetical protein
MKPLIPLGAVLVGALLLFSSSFPTEASSITHSATTVYCAGIVENTVGYNRYAFVPAVFYDQVYAVANEYQVPLYYLAKLLEVESGYDPRSKSGPNSDGSFDLGIAQLNSRYIEEFGYRYGFGEIDPYDPMLSIRVAGRHLSTLYKYTQDWPMAIAAYNCGLRRARTGKWPTQTTKYVRLILGEGGL